MKIESKFPSMGMTIFTQISLLAAEKKAINLGQGFPDFDCESYLFERLNYYVKGGRNQYAPLMGMPALRESIVNMQRELYDVPLNRDDEVTITSGATEGVFCALSALVSQGDEVIVFDPCYDSYVPNIEFNKGTPVRINLEGDFSVDWNKVESAITEKTKVILLNFPHNPGGKVLTSMDLDCLWEIIKDKNIFLISDEVYQHIIFDKRKFLSPFNDSRMRERTLAIASFGKTYHITGWKIGYCLGAPELTKEFRKVLQYVTFCTFTPAQLAISDMMNQRSNYYGELAEFYQGKRDFFCEGLKKTAFKPLPVEGSYFQLVDYSEISDKSDFEFCLELIDQKGVAAIPVSSFYGKKPAQKLIRLCFAKTDDVLRTALDKLQ